MKRSDATNMNESCHTHMNEHMNESCHTHTNESRHTNELLMSHARIRPATRAYCNVLKHNVTITTYYNTLQHTATHKNTHKHTKI